MIAVNEPYGALIASLCERLYICSRLLTCAAERLEWDNTVVQELVGKLKAELEAIHAS